MNEKKRPLFLTRIHENNQNYEYLGSDGLDIDASLKLYLQRCLEFLMKAKKYQKDNLKVKNPHFHRIKYGYMHSEEFEEEVMRNRKEEMDSYKKSFNITLFNEDENYCMYNNPNGLSKRIRIIRELEENRGPLEFSEDFSKETKSWFTRYCILSRFIQAARLIIVTNRLKKNLKSLRLLTPQDVAKFETNENDNGVKSVGIITPKKVD